MKLVIFDVDGTLTNTNQIDTKCFIKAFELEFGIFDINTNWNKYRFSTDSGITQQIFLEKLKRLPSDEDLIRIKKRFVKLLQEASKYKQNLFNEIPGCGKILAELQLSSDWCVAIATGGWYEPATLKLQIAHLEIKNIPLASADEGISREEILTASIVKAKKFYKIENFEKIVFIGDGVWDVEASYQLRIPFIGIGNVQASEKLCNQGAKQVIEDFKDRQKFLELLQSAQIPSICMKIILHITQAEKWEQAKVIGSYCAGSLDTEGFMHCSEANQVVKVANWLFRNQKGLLLLFIDADKVKAEIRYDLVETGELFPHIYGELNTDAVFKVVEFEPGEDGLFTLPLDFE